MVLGTDSAIFEGRGVEIVDRPVSALSKRDQVTTCGVADEVVESPLNLQAEV
jgi:hypothetical protein